MVGFSPGAITSLKWRGDRIKVEQPLGRCPYGVILRRQGGKVRIISVAFHGRKKEAKVVVS